MGSGPLAVIAVAFALAVAAPPAAAAPPFGGLTPLGCVADDGAGGSCRDGAGLAGVAALTVAEDRVYAVSPAASAVTVLRAGTVEPLACVAEVAGDGCADGRALAGAAGVAVAGSFLYVAAQDADAVAAFRIEPDGRLSQLPGTAGCVAEALAGCAPGRALDEPVALVESGGRLYVAARASDAVSVFTVDQETGALAQQGCVAQGDPAVTGCAAGRALEDPAALAAAGTYLGPRLVVVASRGSGGVAVLDGPAVRGCITDGGTEGCATGRGLGGAAVAAVNPRYGTFDGVSTEVYAADPAAGTVAVLRAGGGGSLRQAGALEGVAGVRALAVPPEHGFQDAPMYAGSHLYTGAGGIGVFARDPATGAFTAMAGPALSPAGDVAALAVSPDVSSRFAYAAVPSAGAVLAFARQIGPSCGFGFGPPPSPVGVPGGATTTVAVPPCLDPNGDPLEYTVTGPPAHGTAGPVGPGPSVPYTPAPGYSGPDALTVRASDGGETADQIVRVEVGPTPPPPGAALVDLRAPRVRVLTRVLRMDRRGRVRLRLRADEDSRAAIQLRRRGRRVARAVRRLPAGVTRRVTLRVERRRAGRAVLVVRVRDAAGNERRVSRSVRLRRRA